MSRVISRVFFDRATVTVAKELLGKTICRRLKSGKILRVRITETEAYDGFEDQASHAYKGATTRNVVMFGPRSAVMLPFVMECIACSILLLAKKDILLQF